MSSPTVDRYVTFQGLNCDANAEQILHRIQQHLDQADAASPWQDYFCLKLKNRQTLGQDALFFVGSQITQIREFFEQFEDAQALAWLERVEEECC